MDCPNERTNGWNSTFVLSPLANLKIGLSGSQSLPPSTITGETPLQAYRPIKSSLVTKPPSFHQPLTKQTTRLPSNELNGWHEAEPRPSKQSTRLDATGLPHLPNSRPTTNYG